MVFENIAGITICHFHPKSCYINYEFAPHASKTDDEDIGVGTLPSCRITEGNRAHVSSADVDRDDFRFSLHSVPVHVTSRGHQRSQGQ